MDPEPLTFFDIYLLLLRRLLLQYSFGGTRWRDLTGVFTLSH